MKQLVEDLQWRYATKKYDTSKKVNDTDISIIKQILQLVPTSYGLQPLKFLFIENQKIKEQLFNHSFGQTSIKDASHIIVICSYTALEKENIDSYIENTAYTREIELEQIAGYGEFMKNYFGKLNPEEIAHWSAKQAYIALGVLLQACASLRIDSTPMEGFQPKGYSEVLNLTARKIMPTLVVPIGYRHEEDETQHFKKIRKSEIELFEDLK